MEKDYYVKNVKSSAARVIVKDERVDLAILELQSLPERVKELPLAPDSVRPGQRVHSIGNPGASGALWVYTFGTVRAVYHKEWNYGSPKEPQKCSATIVETQSPTNPGDSGGPVVNDLAQLAAVTSGGSKNDQLMTIFIDVSEVRGLLQKVPK